MTEVITNTIGDRITYCRSTLCMTRKELVEKWGTSSVPTLARWELDTIKIPQKKLLSLADFFQIHGLHVTENWLKDGTGSPPLLLQSDLFDPVDFDSLAQEKLLDINRHLKNFIFGQVKNNLMTPFLKYGDYIGGINLIDEIEVNLIKGELAFLKISIIGLIVGLIKEKIGDVLYIYNFDETLESVDTKQIEAIGKIQWVVRRP